MSGVREAAKAALRVAAKAARAEARARHGAGAEAAIAACGIGFAFPGAGAGRVVSVYLPIGEEIDPLPLAGRLRAEGWRTALPVMVGKDRPLVFRAWESGDPLEARMWGIREPAADRPALEPDLLLVPLLAFDAAGWRLGYGGGYYDRSLAGLRARKPAVAIGLAFDEQRVDAVPHSDYDQRLDWVLTPRGPHRCIES
jgi:5-formyltetrahydrofolate cyclo-ligase